MELLQLVVLALIQGLSEFLPISSSAHLILPSQLLGWPDQGLAFDVAVHVGSLAAVIFYFRRGLGSICRAVLDRLRGRPLSAVAAADVELACQVALATVPAVVIGLLFGGFIEAHLRSIEVIAATTILFGLALGWAELSSRKQTAAVKLTLQLALLIGLAQALALVPGTSRSGITITAAVLLGLSRTEAARFSFLLSIPIILAAGLFATKQLLESGTTVEWSPLVFAVVLSAVSAWSCIALFLKLIEKVGFMPFVYYRLLLGGLLIAVSAGYLS